MKELIFGAISALLLSTLGFTEYSTHSANTTTIKELDLTQKRSLTSIELSIENCNQVEICASVQEEFRYEYDKSLYNLTATPDKDTMVIHLQPRSGAKPKMQDTVQIYIPKDGLEKISAVCTQSGVSFPALAANLNLTNIQGASSVHIPANYKKTLNYTAQNASCTLYLDPHTADYTLNMAATDSAVSIPDHFPPYSSHTDSYLYKKGAGTAKLNLDIRQSAFALTAENN